MLRGAGCGNSARPDLWEPRGAIPGATRRSGSHGGTRLARYRTALGSARETGACLDVAVALGYVEQVDARVLSQLDEVRAMLALLVR